MATDSGSKTKEQTVEYEFLDYCRANSIQTYYSADAAAEAWARENREASKGTEKMSYIYEEYGHYFYTDVYTGTNDIGPISANVVGPTLMLELKKYFIGDFHVVAQIHSHTKPKDGYHNDFPSMNESIYGGDRLAYKLFGYQEMYVVPYSRCNGTFPIIKISDPTTWCRNHPYK